MNVVAIIPARGGSKDIPRKNLCYIGDKPLIAHTIIQSLKSRFIDRTIVSTEDSEIATVSESYGAEVITRPHDLASDTATSESVLLYTLDRIPHVYDILVFLQCTTPLTLAEDIDGTIQKLIDENADTALTVTPYHGFLWRKDSMGINHNKEWRLPRQHYTEQFLETGAVYVMKVEGFEKEQHRFFGKTVLYEVPKERSIEIDEPIDLVIADVYNSRNRD